MRAYIYIPDNDIHPLKRVPSIARVKPKVHDILELHVQHNRAENPLNDVDHPLCPERMQADELRPGPPDLRYGKLVHGKPEQDQYKRERGARPVQVVVHFAGVQRRGK